MKIAYLHQYFRTPTMVGSTRSFEMARRLVKQGHEVHMVTSFTDPTEHRTWFRTVESGIQVHWLPNLYSNSMGNAQRIKAFLRFAFHAGARAASLDPDIVLATSTPLTIAIPGLYASKRKRVPMVFEVRDLWPELPVAIGALQNPVAIWLAKRLEELAYRNSRSIVALSPGMKDGIVAAGYPPDRVHVIPNSSDIAEFTVPKEDGVAFRRRFEWLQDRPLIVYAGTLGRINGVGYLVDIAREAAHIDPDFRFLVVGRGMERALVEQKALEAGIYQKNFFIFESIPKSEVPILLSAADLCVSLFIDLPEMWSNSANKFFDGLAAGRPIAINYGGWQATLLEEHSAGIRIPANDAPTAARMIIDYVRSAEPIPAGTRARELAEVEFARDKLALRLEHVLETAVNEHRGI